MWDEIGSRFTRALAAAAAQRMGAEHALVAACDGADLTNIRAILSALDPIDADALLAEAHKRMREDGAGILAQWRPRGGGPAH